MPVANVTTVAGRGIEPADPAAAVVGEEIIVEVVRRKLRSLRCVKRSASDGTAGRVTVDIPRAVVCRIGRIPLGVRPAVVCPGDAVVDLFPRVLADVVDEEPRLHRIEREGKRVAQPERVDETVVARRRAVERVVRRNKGRMRLADGSPIGLMRSILPKRFASACAWSPLRSRRRPRRACRLARTRARRHCDWCLLRLSRSRRTFSLPGRGNVAVGGEPADSIVNAGMWPCSRRIGSDWWRTGDRRRPRAGRGRR